MRCIWSKIVRKLTDLGVKLHEEVATKCDSNKIVELSEELVKALDKERSSNHNRISRPDEELVRRNSA